MFHTYIILLTAVIIKTKNTFIIPGGVIGNTRDFGSLIPGSNPGRVVQTIKFADVEQDIIFYAEKSSLGDMKELRKWSLRKIRSR